MKEEEDRKLHEFFGPQNSPRSMKRKNKRNIWKREMKQNDNERKCRRRKHIVEEIKNSGINSE